MKLIVFACLFAVGIGAGFLVGRSIRPDASRSSPVRSESADNGEVAGLSPRGSEPDPAGPISAGNTSPSVVRFRWSDVESTNYSQYVSNLRNVGCPEIVISQIIKGDVVAGFEARKRGPSGAIRRALDGPWARMPDTQRVIDDFVHGELGLPGLPTSTGLFTAEEEQWIAQARQMFPAVEGDKSIPEIFSADNSNRVARAEFLSRFLDEQQLLYYKIERDGLGHLTQSLLRRVQPTKEEFLAVARALDEHGIRTFRVRKGEYDPPIVEQILQTVLGPERFVREYRTKVAEFLPRGVQEFRPSDGASSQ